MDTTRTTPSSKIVALAIIVVAVVVASWLIKFGGKTEGVADTRFTTSDAQKTYVNETDTDGDGLKDWEESLWGFNPKNADSDGDGINDGAEKQELQAQILTQQEAFAQLLDPTQDPNWESLSYTEQVTGRLLADYLTFKQTGRALTEKDAAALVENLPTYEIPTKAAPRVYSLTELRLSNAAGEGALYAYGNEVGSVLSVPENETAPNELLVLVSFMRSGDDAVFVRDLQIVITQYNTVISELLAITVPKSIVVEHLGVINALSAVQNDLRSFYSFTEDPFLALSVFTAYNESTTQRDEAFDALRAALADEGVAYPETEPGYVLMSAASLSL
ncbi:MAG: hypothetical protein AMXMBFR44_2650 [Candidatus Campbellbacteria bacterium]